MTSSATAVKWRIPEPGKVSRHEGARPNKLSLHPGKRPAIPKHPMSSPSTIRSLRDPEVLREILETADADLKTIHLSKLKFVHVDHHLFKGTVLTLMHKVFGIPHSARTLLSHRADADMFLWYVYEDDLISAERNLGLGETESRRFIGEFSFSGRPDLRHKRMSLAREFEAVFDRLTEKEQEVLGARLRGATQSEIEVWIGVSHQRVCQIEAKALWKLGGSSLAGQIMPSADEVPDFFSSDHNHFYPPKIRRSYSVEIESNSFMIGPLPTQEELEGLGNDISVIWERLDADAPYIDTAFLENCGFFGITEEIKKMDKVTLQSVKELLVRSIAWRFPGIRIRKLIPSYDIEFLEPESNSQS